jgi:hypothetical protein
LTEIKLYYNRKKQGGFQAFEEWILAKIDRKSKGNLKYKKYNKSDVTVKNPNA